MDVNTILQGCEAMLKSRNFAKTLWSKSETEVKIVVTPEWYFMLEQFAIHPPSERILIDSRLKFADNLFLGGSEIAIDHKYHFVNGQFPFKIMTI